MSDPIKSDFEGTLIESERAHTNAHAHEYLEYGESPATTEPAACEFRDIEHRPCLRPSGHTGLHDVYEADPATPVGEQAQPTIGELLGISSYALEPDARVNARLAIIERCVSNQRKIEVLTEALKDLYDYQQRISSPDTRWELPVYQRVRAALATIDKKL